VHLILPLTGIQSKDKSRVLLVDDHAIVRNAIKQIIEDQTDDFSVEGEAADGQIAVKMALEGDWDLVLLDINLPKMNGIEVLKKVKLVKPDLPVIILSSYPESEYGDISIAHGAACYIEKAKTEKLIETIRWAADCSKRRQES
jgi:DNA-binding NarL/FixJ family response regulator